jgi:Tfp pilus assembly protein PilN
MINLLPYKEKKIIKKLRIVRLLITCVSGFICFCIVAGILLLPTIITINSRFSLASKQVSSLEKSGEMASSVDIATLEKRARLVNSKLAITSPLTPMEYISLIKSYISTGITINRFAVTGEKIIEISGIAQNRDSLQTLVSSLKKEPRISVVDSPVTNFIKNKDNVFTLLISFK